MQIIENMDTDNSRSETLNLFAIDVDDSMRSL